MYATASANMHLHGTGLGEQWLTVYCRCAQACAERGIEFMDAPISGGPVKAKAGTLTIMCGAPQSTFERVQPVLQCMGTHVQHMGPHGAGTATKLVSLLGSLMQERQRHNACLCQAQQCNSMAWSSCNDRLVAHQDATLSYIMMSSECGQLGSLLQVRMQTTYAEGHRRLQIS